MWLVLPLPLPVALVAALLAAGSAEAQPTEALELTQSNDLRGYASGQDRDRALWVGQVEYRRPLFWRIGGVVFAGVGGVAPGLDRLGDSTVLPSAGVGSASPRRSSSGSTSASTRPGATTARRCISAWARRSELAFAHQGSPQAST